MAEWLSLTELALRPGDAQRPVACRNGELLTHAHFVQDVRRWHTAFGAHGGDRFALYFDDAYDFAAALFGAWHAGKEAVLPGDAQPATVERLLPEVDGCAGLLAGALLPGTPTGAALQPLDLQRTRAVIYTSGSSGQPLAITKRLAQLESEIGHQQQLFGPRLDVPGLTIYSTVSHQHIYGLLFVTLWPLAAGRAVDAERLAYPEQMAHRLAAGPSLLVSSPAHLKRLPETLDWSGARANLRAVYSSGGPLPPESAVEALITLGQSPIEVYGSSETGGVAWRQRATHGDRWDALPGVDWRLQNETLCVRSSHLGDDDWWETSDRAKALDGGGFVLLGRADRIVKIEEKRVSLVAVEQQLLASRLVAEARALLVPGEGGARLGVVAVPTPDGWDVLRTEGKRALNDRLRRELLQTLERVALPRRFRYVRELPVNSQGKATEALLLSLFQPSLPKAEWREKGPQRAVLALDVVPELRVFDGHFPGMPVLPGVAQVDWAVEFAAQCFALPPRFCRAEQLKFQLPVIPPQRLELTLEWRADAGQLVFRFASERGVHSGGRLLCEGGDA
jgi:acyl-coenzyme A synthetase/AMP-(fatty) acid ligase/3-hydroxymyristoyl/3-hydroxydecanoyl-(acyl carrier protein) dehydratase